MLSATPRRPRGYGRLLLKQAFSSRSSSWALAPGLLKAICLQAVQGLQMVRDRCGGAYSTPIVPLQLKIALV